MSDDLSGDMLAPSWPNLVEERITPEEVNHQLQEATESRIETGSYFEALIHRRNIHFTAIPMKG